MPSARCSLLLPWHSSLRFRGPLRHRARTCPCTVFGPTDAPLGDALQDQPGRGGDEVPLRRGRATSRRCASTSSRTTSARTWGTSGRAARPAARRGPVHERDGVGLAGGRRCRYRCRSAADTTYITSYHSSQGQFGFNPGYFSSAASTAPPLHAPSDALAGGNGVYRYGASGFPDSTFNATNYWVDAVLEPAAAGRHPRAARELRLAGGRRHRRRRPARRSPPRSTSRSTRSP